MKYNVKIVLFLVSLFLLSQVVGLFFIMSDIKEVKEVEGRTEVIHPKMTAVGPRPEVQKEFSVVYLLSGVFLGTLLLLLIIRFGKINYWKILFSLAVFTTITIALGVFMEPVYAAVIAIFLTFLKIYYRHTLIHNLTELLIYSGIAVLFVPLFDLFWIVILLLLISAYDAFAVWQSKHMIRLAKFQTGSGLFAGLLINFEKGGKRMGKGVTKKLKRKGKMVKEAILGGGDVAFPLIFAGVVMESLIGGASKEVAFFKALIIPLVLAGVLFLLLWKGKEGRFYPAMPFLTAGCLLGLGLVSVL